MYLWTVETTDSKHSALEMILFFFFAGLVIPLASLYFFKTKTKHVSPPGPPGLPFIGNLHQFIMTCNLHIYLWKLSQKYGPIMSMKFGKIPVIILSSPKLVKEALKAQDLAFSGRPGSLGRNVLSYGCLDIAFTSYNSSWRELRRIFVLHMLSIKQVQSFRPIREDEVSRVMGDISSKGSSGHIVNLSEIMMFYTGNLICRVAFGKDYSNEESGRRRFHRLMIEHEAMQAGLFVSDYAPWFGWVDKVNGMMSKLYKAFNDMDDFFQELIDEHLDPKTPKPVNPDVLHLLIQLKDERSCSIDLSWNRIKAIIMNIIIAGTDTGAALLIWTMTALIKNPNAMKKLQNEIRDLVGTKGVVNEEDVQKLCYLKAVIKESLRLYPPAPLLLPRETLEDTVLAGYKIKPKTVVYINAWAVARDPEAWENPNEFMPERFLNSKIDVIGQDFEVIPFGAGRRGCPGISLGLAVVELLLANLLCFFDWELPCGIKKEDIDTEVLPGITMHKKNPLCLVPKPYSTI